MGDDSEWMKLPIDQKCEHKVNTHTHCLSLSRAVIIIDVLHQAASTSADRRVGVTLRFAPRGTHGSLTHCLSAVSSTMCLFSHVSKKPRCSKRAVVVTGPASVGSSALYSHYVMQGYSLKLVGASVTPHNATVSQCAHKSSMDAD